MSRITDPVKPSATPAPEGSTDAYVCPFCGLSEDHASAGSERTEGSPCPRCGMSDTPSTRKATKSRIGPWHVRQVRNPWAPGMKWETLISLIRRGQVTTSSIVRGPTTHQLWKRAAHVKGLSREFGVCYSCGESIETAASLCPHCNRLQEPPANPDVLLESRDAHAPAVSAPQESSPAPAPVPAPVPVPASVEPSRAPEPQATEISSSPLPEPGVLSEPVAPAPKRELAELNAGGNGNGKGHGRSERPLEKVLSPAAERPLNLPDRPATLEEGFKPPLAMETSIPPVRRGITPTDDRPADTLLTAQELATAFQLNFNPKSKPRVRGSGRFMKLVLVMVMLIVSIGCLLYVRPELREKGMRWARQQLDSLKSRSSPSEPQVQPAAPMPAAPAPTNRAPAASAPSRNQPQLSSTAPPPLMQVTPVRIQTTTMPAQPSPTTAPAIARATTKPSLSGSASGSNAVPQAQPQQAALVEKPKANTNREATSTPSPTPAAPTKITVSKAPEPKVEPKPAAPPPPPAPAAPAVDPVEQARTLWRQAIDAEIGGKFREAVRCYEQIKKLPADVQPEGLDVRLEQAKKEANKQAK